MDAYAIVDESKAMYPFPYHSVTTSATLITGSP